MLAADFNLEPSVSPFSSVASQRAPMFPFADVSVGDAPVSDPRAGAGTGVVRPRSGSVKADGEGEVAGTGAGNL